MRNYINVCLTLVFVYRIAVIEAAYRGPAAA
jgi:hypothetical protein